MIGRCRGDRSRTYGATAGTSDRPRQQGTGMTDTPEFWIGTSWKMNKTLAEARAFADGAGRGRCRARSADPALRHPALHRGARGQGDACSHVGQGRRAEHALGRRGRLDRRDLAADAEGLRPRHGRTRSFGTARAFRRNRRDGRAEDRGGGAPRPRSRWSASAKRWPSARPAARPRCWRAGRGGAWQAVGHAAARTILLAYEPVWAIGENGIPATADYADARQAEIIEVAESHARPPRSRASMAARSIPRTAPS